MPVNVPLGGAALNGSGNRVVSNMVVNFAIVFISYFSNLLRDMGVFYFNNFLLYSNSIFVD